MIEEIATKHNIPIFSIIIKQSINDAISLLKKEIIDQVDDVKNQIHEMINDNTNPNETILIIGVGNTLGVSQ